MELPKQKKIYSGLETKFTDLKSLTTELKEKNLTGLLKISFDACEGIIFLTKAPSSMDMKSLKTRCLLKIEKDGIQ